MDKYGIKKSTGISLVEALDRILNKGVVIDGDIIISVAEIDMIYLGLKVLLCSVETMEKLRHGEIISSDLKTP